MIDSSTKHQSETIVLVHGIWMHGLIFLWLAQWLKKSGYRVERFSYRSVLQTPSKNAEHLAHFVSKIDTPVVHLIGHSLGGVVILHLLDQVMDLKPGRIVLLGCPVKGSRVANVADRIPLLGIFLLGNSTHSGLLGGVPKFSGQRELGTIIGTKPIGIGHLFSKFDGINDGTVLAKETVIEHASDSVEINVTHTILVFSRRVARQISCFLENARFCRTDNVE